MSARRAFSGMTVNEHGRIEPRGALTLHAVTAHKRVACVNRFNRVVRALGRIEDRLTSEQWSAVANAARDVDSRIRYGQGVTHSDAIAIDATVRRLNYLLLQLKGN